MATNYILKEKLFARRACSFSLLRSSKEKELSAHICVCLRLIKIFKFLPASPILQRSGYSSLLKINLFDESVHYKRTKPNNTRA